MEEKNIWGFGGTGREEVKGTEINVISDGEIIAFLSKN